MLIPGEGAQSPAHGRLLLLAALAGFGVSLAVLYPGQYTYDSAFQIWQARSGRFFNITPVPMLWVWSQLLRIFDNPASLLVLNLAMFWSGIALCLHALRAPIGFRVGALMVCGLNPLTLAQMAHLLSDAHMTAALILAVGLLAQAMRRRRAPLIWIAWILILHAGSIRQNALVAVIPVGILAVGAMRMPRALTVRSVLVAVVLTAVLTAAFGTALDRTLTVERRSLWPMLALWDLAAVSVATDELLLPSFTHGAGMSVEELRETRAFDPVSTTALFSRSRSGIGSGLDQPYSREQEQAIARAWWDAVTRHPGAYLAHRMQTMVLLTARQGGDRGGIGYYVGRARYRDNPLLPSAWFPDAQKDAYAVFASLSRTWMFAGLPYLLIHLIVVGVALLRRRSLDSGLALGISASALLYAASFFVLAPSAELRYLTWPIVTAPLALALLIGQRWSGERDSAPG